MGEIKVSRAAIIPSNAMQSSGWQMTALSADGAVVNAIKDVFERGVGVLWHPFASGHGEPEDVPSPISEAAAEAWTCHAAGLHRAAAIMARAVVEATAKDKGATSGSLMAKIDKLYDDEVIGKGVKGTAHEIRFIGNEMAHGDFVINIGEDTSADLLSFMDELLYEVYQRDAKLSRFRAARQKTAPGSP
ncbi:DUF4145 domain-containing protein [Occultella gossypii]|uniref:DUF4145 domain-containing protein n=1 Tax=Occultella gossypii TaxID=2800820 RepID=A0ABS7S891_9MICO|nr:DUF4145 domain-containing protein [Occultella gossypii]MBZ2195970.1 DUF4145 domain-containing protein [Occultella gossypii]